MEHTGSCSDWKVRASLRMLLNIEEKRMNKATTQRKPNRLTVRQLNSELQRLRRRVEDLEDLRDLNAAIERNAGRPGIPWNAVKQELGLK